jgi:hypothetical protein
MSGEFPGQTGSRAGIAIARFLTHGAAATIGSLIAGMIVLELVHPSGTANFWFDAPYGPPLWITALLLGSGLNLAMNDKSARFAWVVGTGWLALWAGWLALDFNPKFCHGCSLLGWFWSELFSYSHCTEECLGQMFVTTPALNSITYSFGAALALSLRKRLPPMDLKQFGRWAQETRIVKYILS